MTQDKGFSIISVNSDDDDEIVIQAGIKNNYSDEASETETASVQAITDSQNNEVPASDEEQASAELPEAAQSGAKVSKSSGRTEYQETTLDDLKTKGPFHKTQLIVVGAAVVFLVGFVVVYIISH